MKTDQYEKPATGISLQSDMPDSKFYRVNCKCGNTEDDINFEVEAIHNQVIVHTWTDQFTDCWSETVKPSSKLENETLWSWYWYGASFVNSLIRKIKLTWGIWVHGRVKYESWTVMDKQQALNYAETLKTAIKELEETNIQSK